MSEFLSQFSHSSILLFLFALITLSLSALLGKVIWKRKKQENLAEEDELKIVLGAILSLFGLLIGFLLTFAISGYNDRIQAEEDEAVAIGHAFQRSSLLEDKYQIQAEAMLQDYLSLRIQFYESTDNAERANARMASIQLQTKMWLMLSKIAKEEPNSMIVTVLDACNNLYTAQQRTISSWRNQVPFPAWILLIVFALCSNFLIGYNIRGIHGNNSLILLLPILTTLALFMIAEIDVPGEGIIHVTPENLKAVRITVSNGGLAP